MKRKRCAIVMGATSGIGMEVALLLAKRGWKVGIAGRREERLCRVMDANKDIAVKKQIDVTAQNAAERLAEMAEELGGIDLYVHSSGIGWQNTGLDTDKELLTVETNGTGFTRMLSAVFNLMAERGGGHIACITSIAGTKGLGAAPAYSATKRYQSHYLECLTQLAGIRGLDITTTDIRPGFVDTDLIANSHFPLKLPPKAVAADIVQAIERKKAVVVIDWRYRLLVALWRLLPRWIWTRMKIQ